MALKLIRKPFEVLTGTTGTGAGLRTVTGSWGIYFIAPNNGVAHVAVTGDVEQICVWVRNTDGLNIQTFRARRGAESMEQCALNVMVPLTKGHRWFVQAEGQGKTVTIMHDFKPSPPPCVIARFWGGGRGGVKADWRGATTVLRESYRRGVGYLYRAVVGHSKPQGADVGNVGAVRVYGDAGANILGVCGVGQLPGRDAAPVPARGVVRAGVERGAGDTRINVAGGGVIGVKEAAHGAGQCFDALHRGETVLPEVVHVGTGHTAPRAYGECQWGDAGNGIGPVACGSPGGPVTDLPRRREHGQPNPRHLRLRGPATHLQHGCRSAFDADTHTPALTPVGGERRGA